jgi:hypothetical protein
MPFLFRDIVICHCSRPAMRGSAICRTCYEDGLRRQWRDDARQAPCEQPPAPLQRVSPRIRVLLSPEMLERHLQDAFV